MAKARAKNKAKSGNKAKAKKALKKKPVAQAKSAKSVKAKKPAPKKVAKKPAPKKQIAAKPKTKPAVKAKPVAKAKPVVKAKVTPIAPKATPMAREAAPKKALAPAVDRALAQADVEGLISRLPPPVQPVVKTLRRLVLETAPEASELLDDGSPAYFANGVFARIVPSEREVLVKFLRGGHLPSAGELTGDGETRFINLTTLNELKENVLRKLVREAVMLNMSSPPPAQA